MLGAVTNKFVIIFVKYSVFFKFSVFLHLEI